MCKQRWINKDKNVEQLLLQLWLLLLLQIKPVDKIYGVQKSRKSHPCGNLVLTVHTTLLMLFASLLVRTLTMQKEHNCFISFDAKKSLSSLFSLFLFDVMFGSDDGKSEFYFLTANTAAKDWPKKWTCIM